MTSSLRRGAFVAVAVAVSLAITTQCWAARKQAAIAKPKFDPKAERVEMFDGINNKSLAVKMVPRDPLGGNVVIENLSDKPLTVELPDAFVGIQVARQFGAARGGVGGVGGGGVGGGQAAGGGFGGGAAGGLGGGMAGGGGVFSIPAERIVKVPYQSVCLEHGKHDPDSTMTYRVIPVEQYTQNEPLAGLLTLVGTKDLDPQAAQAAAWFLANNMSWEQLAAKTSTEVPGLDAPYFSAQTLAGARQLVIAAEGVAREKAAEREKNGPPKKKTAKAADRVIRGR